MNDIAIVMVSVDRSPKRNYLGDTLMNLERGGVFRSGRKHSFHISNSRCDSFVDDCVTALGLPIAVHKPEDQLNVNQNVVNALRIGALSGATWVLFLEDDIDVCARFLDSVGAWLDEHRIPEGLVYAFGAAYDVLRTMGKRGATVWNYPVDGFYGTQAIALHASDAADLAKWLEEHEQEYSIGAYDIRMHDWATSRGVTHFLASVPSFVQHTGQESIIAPRAEVHTFTSWPGQEWSYQ